MLRALRQLSAAFALLAYLLALPEGVLVLCMGAGEHRAIEAACQGHSAQDDAAHVDEPCACDGDCGPCADAPLGLDHSALHSLAQRESVAPAPLAVSPAPCANLLGAPASFASGTRAPEPLLSSSPPPQAHVVLRI